ncbi:MAG: CoA-binding protein [Ignavibacteriaceae bacterium]
MIAQESIVKFLSAQNIAVVGVSRNNKKFGFSAFNTLKAKGFNVYAVNPNAELIDGDTCYKSLDLIPDKIDSVLVVLPPEKTHDIAKQAHSLSINNIWLQQGAESDETISYCNDKGMNIIYKQCILMFTEPLSFPHNFHRWVNKITRKLPV